MKMGLTDEYFQLYHTYEAKYGKIALLQEKGTFYEAYEYPTNDCLENDFLNDDTSVKYMGNARQIAHDLNMICTLQDKSKPVGYSNCRMVGFPSVVYDRHKLVLLEHGYVVIRVDQIKDANGKITRSVKEILTPSTYIQEQPTESSASLTCIYVEFQKYGTVKDRYDEYVIVCGISMIDITTGKSSVCEAYSKSGDRQNAIQEIYRFILAHPCKQVLIYIQDLPVDSSGYIKYIADQLNLTHIDRVSVNEVPKEYRKLSYQQAFLDKVFYGHRHGIDIITELNLDRQPYSLMAYMLLCQYCNDIDPQIINRLSPPEVSWTDEQQYCILTHNAVRQLDILPHAEHSARSTLGNKTVNSLLSVVDGTSTMVGKRYLKNMLLNPITDVNQLEFWYSCIEEFMSSYTDGKNGLIVEIERCLKDMHDVERLQRKLILQSIKPLDLVHLCNSYFELIKLSTLMYNSGNHNLQQLYLKHFTPEQSSLFNNCYKYFTTKLDLDALSKANMVGNKINTMDLLFPEDEQSIGYYTRLKQITTYFDQVCAHLNSFLGKTRGEALSFDFGKSDEKITLSTTHAKAKIIKDSLVNKELCGDLEFKVMNGKTILTSTLLLNVCHEYEILKDDYTKHMYTVYQQILSHVVDQYPIFHVINKFIGIVDYLKGNAKIALKYHYYRPVCDPLAVSPLPNNEKQTADGRSYIDVEELRHPIIERIIHGQYIPNDIRLDENYSGLVLYGLNSGGKSSFTKALGLCIIMAQAGMYVPGKLKFRPYRKIITRLSGEDNVFKGESSFIVEMSELRTILTNADKHTLVLGDELCRGTENVSATSLTLASIQTLIDRHSSFVFSTHLHQLADSLAETKIHIMHMSAVYNPDTNQLTYNRKFQPGPGNSVYGLEVAKYVGLPTDFINLANGLRKSLAGESTKIVNTKTSKYNAHIYMNECSLCKSTINLHTHHITPQNQADEHEYITYYHKNSSFNLMVLCEKCHVKIHQE